MDVPKDTKRTNGAFRSRVCVKWQGTKWCKEGSERRKEESFMPGRLLVKARREPLVSRGNYLTLLFHTSLSVSLISYTCLIYLLLLT